jgi:WD40 repeat protein/serine/threonine protein kinase
MARILAGTDGPDASAVLRALRKAYTADREQGKVRLAQYYQRLLPGHDALIAKEYARLERQWASARPVVEERPAAEPRMLGHYRLLHEIGRGGQGQVLLAEDTRLKRKVALKILAPGFDPKNRERFEREAAAASRLDHPGICAVYEAGDAEGTHYIAMRYVEGESLAQRIASAKEGKNESATPPASPPSGPSTREEFATTLRFVERALRALHVAHEVGLIHRDVKPGNIMIDPNGEPVILDFGLAGDETGNLRTLTLSGDLMGTPAYMSPEQLAAHRIRLDRRTDVYSMGVTLYECLTLRRPFDAPTVGETYQRILATDPPDPRRRNPRISREITVILETALEKDRDRRYRTALDFADDLRRARNLEPIRARPAGLLLRFRRWTQRQPLVAAMVLGLFLLLTAGLVVALTLLERVRDEHDRKQAALEDLQSETQARRQAEAARKREERAKRKAEEEKAQEAQEKLVAVEALAQERERTLRRFYGQDIREAQQALRDRRLGTVDLFLGRCPQDLRGWEWYYLRSLADQDGRKIGKPAVCVTSVAFSPDGKRVVHSGGEPNLLSGSMGKGELRVCEVESGDGLLNLEGHKGPVICAAYSLDGTRIVSGAWNGEIILWDASTGKSLRRFRDTNHWIGAVSFDRAGRRILTAAGTQTLHPQAMRGWAKVWDVEQARVVLTLEEPEAWIFAVAYSPDETRIATGGGVLFPNAPPQPAKASIKVWDVSTGQGRVERVLEGHGDAVRSLSFSRDGRRLLSGSLDGTVREWDVASGKEQSEPLRHPEGVSWATYGRDDTWILASTMDRRIFISMDNSIRIWARESGKQVAVLRGHTAGVPMFALSPDGNWVVSGSLDRTVRRWSAQPLVRTASIASHRQRVLALAIDDAGARIVSAGGPMEKLDRLEGSEPDNTIRIWDATTRQCIGEIEGPEKAVCALALGPGGSSIASAAVDGSIHVWDTDAGSFVLLGHHRPWATAVAFREDGGRIASGGVDGVVRQWSWGGARGRAEELVFKDPPRHRGGVQAVVFSPGGKTVLSAGRDKLIRLWDAATGRPLRSYEGHEACVMAVAFDKTGKRFVSGGEDSTVCIWDVDAREPRRILRGHNEAVVAVAFSPDGSRVVSGSGTQLSPGVVKVWDAMTGEALLTLDDHRGTVHAVLFTPDGRAIVSGGQDGTVRIWGSAAPE